MFTTAKSSFFIVSLLLSLNLFAAELTKASVTKFLSKIDSAVNSLDADGVANALSDNVIIIMNINVQGQTQVLTPSKQEYIAMLQQGWSASKNYTYSKSNMAVKIYSDKAIVTADVIETMSIQGQTISGKSKEEATIEVINGNFLVTKVVGHTTM